MVLRSKKALQHLKTKILFSTLHLEVGHKIKIHVY